MRLKCDIFSVLFEKNPLVLCNFHFNALAISSFYSSFFSSFSVLSKIIGSVSM